MTHPFRLAIALSLLALLAACGPEGPGPAGSGRSPQTYRSGTTGKPGSSPDLDADRFKGQSAKEILASLGEPSYRRREPPAEVWQYYGQGCILDLFLYDEAGGQKVAHTELRSRNFNDDPDTNCLPQLLQGKRQPMS